MTAILEKSENRYFKDRVSFCSISIKNDSFCQYRHDNPNTIPAKEMVIKSILEQSCRKHNTSLTISNGWSTARGGTKFLCCSNN